METSRLAYVDAKHARKELGIVDFGRMHRVRIPAWTSVNATGRRERTTSRSATSPLKEKPNLHILSFLRREAVQDLVVEVDEGLQHPTTCPWVSSIAERILDRDRKGLQAIHTLGRSLRLVYLR